jgi:hypothetical protein
MAEKIKLRQRPQKPGIRKQLEYYAIELVPEPIKLYYDKEGKPCSEEETPNKDDFDYEEVPSPNLQEVVNFFTEKNIPLSKVEFNYDYRDYNSYDTSYVGPKFSYTQMEPEEDYQLRLLQYEKELKEYQQWYKENRDAIKAEKARLRAIKKKEKEEQKEINKKKRLLEQKEKLEKELLELEKK